LLHVVIGDKGSYFCSAFGAPVAYEDNARRATFAALALQQQITAEGSMPPLQIGITQGIMRCGAYGSIRRCTYGIMSDEVNLAARLMSLATPGEILVSGDVRNAISTHVALEPRPPVYLKGKAEPWPIFAIGSIRQERAVRLHEPDYALPIIGRANELLVAGRILDQVLAGHGQVLGITAEAGLGKSRLVAEIIRLANQRGMVGYGGTCQATGTRSSYLVWQPIWRAIFDSDPTAPLRRQIRALEGFVHDWAPTLIEATPLLRPLLGLALPENRFTQSLEPKDRQRALHALLSECLAAVVQEVQSDGGGLLIVLEDAHWIDAASAELLMELIQSLDRLPVLLLLAYRPQIIDEPSVLPIDQLPHLTEIRLSGLDLLAAEQLIRVKLLQLFPARGSAVPAALVKQLMERAQGNPFYLEELLSYLHDRAIDPREVGALEALALPESLHRLILSRLDQLSGQQQIILKTSSVIGRRFLVGWLRGAFPSIAPPAELAAELVALAQLELTPLDTPEPELAYLFKHVITREVAYESLGAATRAMLHGQLASYLEQITEAVTGIDGLLDLLAYHYEQSDNLTKKRLYLRRAGEAAAARYANTAALAYLSRAMELAPANDLVERATLLLLREQVYAVQGERRLQNADLDALDVLVATLQAPHITAEVALRRARYANETTDFSAAERAAREAAALAQDAKLLPLEATAYQRLGWAQYCQRQYRLAQASLERSLALADTADDKHQRCATLNALSAVAADQGYYEKARNYLEQSFATAREIGNRRMEIYALSDLAGMTGEQGQLITAVGYFEQCLTAAHAIGDRRLACRTLGNLGFAYLLLGNYVSAQDYCERCIVLAQATSDLQQMAIVSGNLGHIALGQGNVAGAARYFQQCLTLAEQQGDRMLVGMAWRGQGNVAYTQGDLTTADQAFQQSVTLLREVGSPALIAEPLAGLAQVALARGDMAAALALIEEILANLETGTLDGAEEPFAVYLACYTVLRANSDPRATALLARARAELLARADHIPDAIVRQIFLEHVPVHRDLMAAE
jgi:predicted ATPase